MTVRAMGIGAVFGAMNTMCALVAARPREIGTLRALGFSRGSILMTSNRRSWPWLAAGLYAAELRQRGER